MDDEPGFEAALAGLEKTVEALESGELGLDAALQRYEEGVRLLARCQSLLEGAERRVAMLTGVDGAGNPVVTDFDAAATTARENGASRE